MEVGPRSTGLYVTMSMVLLKERTERDVYGDLWVDCDITVAIHYFNAQWDHPHYKNTILKLPEISSLDDEVLFKLKHSPRRT